MGIIDAPDAVLLNQVSGELLYVSVGELGELAGPTVKVVVLPDHIVSQQLAPAVGPQRGKVVVNLVRTVSVMRIDALLDATTYHVLWGKL